MVISFSFLVEHTFYVALSFVLFNYVVELMQGVSKDKNCCPPESVPIG